MKTPLCLKLALVGGLLGAGRPGLAADSTTAGSQGASVRLGASTITVIEVYGWRDWMPIVSQPGPDHGSPLHIRIRLGLDNSAGTATKLTFVGRVLDDSGKSYPLTFGAQPNYHVLPVAVASTYRDLDPAAREAVDAKYDVVWSGGLKAGEVREVELLAGDGPYLPVGSAVRVQLTWTNPEGASVTVTSAPASINRTD